MKKIIGLALFLIFLPDSIFAAGPRVWGKVGSAAAGSVTLTVGGVAAPFGPNVLCVENLDATNAFYIDWSDGVASTVDDSTNIKIAPAKSYCFQLNNQDVKLLFTVGLIAAAGTPAYNIFAIAAK